MLKIIKRNGEEVSFDRQKIIDAVNGAMLEVDGQLYETDTAKEIASDIEKRIRMSKTPVGVEAIQDWVELELMVSERPDVARAYIRYRYKKEVARETQSTFFDAIGEKLEARNVQNQNANIDEHSFGGRIGEASGVMTKKYALDYIVSKMAKENHLNNRIYIHDLDSYAVGMHNCLSIPFDKLLAEGFNTRQTDVRPANSINTAFQLVAVIFQIQSLQQFGGVSATHLDWTMEPYVRKSFRKHYIISWLKTSQEFLGLNLLDMLFDNYEVTVEPEYTTQRLWVNQHKKEFTITYNRFDEWVEEHKREFEEKTGLTFEDFTFDSTTLDPTLKQMALYDTIIETKQAVEGMYHNLNTLQSRSGNQLPFTSINYGTCTSLEGRMVIRALLEVSLEGLGKLHKTSIFPCGIFQCKKGTNRKEGEPNYDLFQLALKSTAKRLYPNYANVDWSGNEGYDPNDPATYFSTMGCRTANGADINALPGQNKQMKDGRGNICPVTIIMPTLAMEAMEEVQKIENFTEDDIVDTFIDILKLAIADARDMLIERFEWICSQSPSSAKFMYENGTMFGYDPEEGIRSALKHGTLAIGQLGLAETLQILLNTDHTTERGMEVAKKIENTFKTLCAEYKEKYKLNFGVYYTPAENLCYTAMQKFKKQYGVIPEVSDKDFFTNSMHVPVWKRMSPFDKIEIESQLTGYSSAGCITYVEFSDQDRKNLAALEAVVQFAMDHDIPYFAINVPCDTCMECGHCGEIDEACPKCGSTDIQRLRRVTGYLTGNYTTAFNKGKIQEVLMRVHHLINP